MVQKKSDWKVAFFFGLTVEDVSIERQGQGADYETYRSVLKVREDCRISSNAEVGALLKHLAGTVEDCSRFDDKCGSSDGAVDSALRFQGKLLRSNDIAFHEA